MIRNYFNRLSYWVFLFFFLLSGTHSLHTRRVIAAVRVEPTNGAVCSQSPENPFFFFSRWCWNHTVEPPPICKQTKLVDTRRLSRSPAVNTAWCLRSGAGTTVDALRQIRRLDTSEVGETLSLSGTVAVCPIRHFCRIRCDENRVSASHESFSHGYIFCR